MSPSKSDAPEIPFDEHNTARATRARYDYQDQCVAYRCAQNLVGGAALSAVIVEWSSDYLAVPAAGPIEVVSIKHREPDAQPWTPSQLKKPVRDLHRYWREMDEACRCVFASNRPVHPDHEDDVRARLSAMLDTSDAEASRFGAALDLVTPALPTRNELPSVGRDAVRGALRELGREPRFAAECWDALVAAVARLSVEEPPTDRERALRLAGAARHWRRRAVLTLADQTLRLADLRQLVLITHDDLEQESPRPIPVSPVGVRRTRIGRGDSPEWTPGAEIGLGAGRYLPHRPIEALEAPDASAIWRAAGARQLTPTQRDVRIRGVRVSRSTPISERWSAAVSNEPALLRTLARVGSVPRLAELVGTHTVVTVPPAGRPLDIALGLLDARYPALRLDALLRGVAALGPPLDALHSAGFGHRDLRPATLLVTARGGLALRDLGIATLPAMPGEGPDGYRAPEQHQAGRAGPATDVYQLAAIVYHAVTGRLVGPRPVPAAVFRPTLAPELATLLDQGLHSDPASRPGVREFCVELAALAGHAVAMGG